MNKILCYGCMEYIDGEYPCPLCGYNNHSSTENIIFLEPGTLVGNRYLVGKVLGYGGFGITYIGWDKINCIKVAIKEYMPFGLSNRQYGNTTVILNYSQYAKAFNEGIDKFINEAETLRKFNHVTSIMTILDLFKDNNTAYIVMPYHKGKTLLKYLQESGDKISYQNCLEIMIPILEALEKVHQVGLIHRDISPDNIFITEENGVKLLDFGASRELSENIDISINNYTVMVKHGYAPPEQYYQMGVQGVWTDIYASAATIYRCITGIMPPFSIERMHNDSLIRPKVFDDNIPKIVDKAVVKALNLKSEERYQSMTEYIYSLKGNRDKIDKQRKIACVIGLSLLIICVMIISLSINFKNNSISSSQENKDIVNQAKDEMSRNEDINTEPSTIDEIVEQEIYFEDINLENTIRDTIGKYDGVITKEDVVDMNVLYASGKDITSIEGLQHLEGLNRLDLSQNNIEELSPLSELTELGFLMVDNNLISDITPLEHLIKISELGITNNNIKNIQILSNFKYLTWLNLSNNKIEDISPLKNMERLIWMNAANNDIWDISPLEGAKKMESIAIDDNELRDISILATLPELENISAANNYISDISVLSGMENLISLNVVNNDITDFSVLDDLEYLEFIGIELNP